MAGIKHDKFSDFALERVERLVDELADYGALLEEGSFDSIEAAREKLAEIESAINIQEGERPARELLGNRCIGPDAYERFFGLRVSGDIPPVPAEVLEYLRSDPEIAGSHRLLFIPKELGGDPFTINSLRTFAEKYCRATDLPAPFFDEGWYQQEPFANTPLGDSAWVLIPDGDALKLRGQSEQAQWVMLGAHPEYRVAKTLELATLFIMNALQNWQYLGREGFCICAERASSGINVGVTSCAEYGIRFGGAFRSEKELDGCARALVRRF